MDNKKLAKLIDGIVKLRIEKILKSNDFRALIKEEAQKEVIKILLEAKSEIRTKRKPSSTSLKTVASVLGEDTRRIERTYPTLPNRAPKVFSKNPALNAILNQTAGDPNAMASYNNQSSLADMVDGGQPVRIGANSSLLNNRISVDAGNLANEALAVAQSELSKYGMAKSITEEVNMDSPGSANTNFKDMFDDKYVEYNEDISQVDDGMILEGANEGMEHVAKALTRDYSQLMIAADQKAKEKRPVL